jgi:Poly(hydroxyalcanoate) granule associated protein (phasin)
MVIEAWKNYAQLVNGITKTTRERALATAKALLAQAGLEDVAADASERVTKLAEEILTASAANRQILTNFVAHEVDQAVGRLGLARREDLEALRAEIAALRTSTSASPRPSPEPAAPAKRAPAKKAVTKAPAKEAPAKKAPAKKAPATRVPVKKAPVNQPAASETATPEPRDTP